MIEGADFLFLHEPDFVIFGEVVNFDYSFFDYSFSAFFFGRGHFALLSRHFPAARRKVARISGSGIFSASALSGRACLSGATNSISLGGRVSLTINSGLTTNSISVTVGAPSSE